MKSFYKSLVISKKTNSGRNNTGQITIRHQEGGCKPLYRRVNFNLPFNNKEDNYKLIRSEYDPNRSAFIALVYNFGNCKYDYIILPEGLNTNEYIVNPNEIFFKMKPGYRTVLTEFPLGAFVHNLSLKPNKGLGVLCRSRGNYAKILQKNVKGQYVRVKLPSGEERLLHKDCKATFGIVSLASKSIGKKNAGRSRRLGKRPSVRGVAMNPVDHPHGGGEGKTSGGRFSVSPWGKLSIGKPTRSNKKNSMIVKSRKQV
jgi:large subunit ribosomal protein L2